ncbi:NisI/SpaI family lantibiotic immunity lipoprotein [Velocimicrobium porci]|uniref:NisI/SpaI family lantibiotic immunity lipoprotein n=1 Tax=Velocimicrobium porci TaxID=2606634 RepID=A0A6L5XV86_9FIRM|nr:NisI/SpaI family lantibiotic immunity lipoprotein [Velocimicrobium porci]MSS62736.1 NisI/SpaI family lantibiotic immunity lipoprotein [Velocimicrobium porci]
MNKIFYTSALLFLCLTCLSGCSSIEKKLEEQKSQKEKAVLNEKDLSEFNYQNSSYTILNQTKEQSELGSWVGIIQKYVLVNKDGSFLNQYDIDGYDLSNLVEASENSDQTGSYVITYYNIYKTKENSPKELILDINDTYYLAVPTKQITSSDKVLSISSLANAADEAGNYHINQNNCTELICGEKTYKISDTVMNHSEVGDYLAVLNEHYTFLDSTKKPLTQEELKKIEITPSEASKQKRISWTYTGVYKIKETSIFKAVAVNINGKYHRANLISG